MALPGSTTGRRRNVSQLVALILGFQAAALLGQSAEVEVSNPNPRVGDTLRLTISLDRLLGPEIEPEIEIEEPDYPEIIRKTRGPVVQSVVRGPFGPRDEVTQVISFDFRCVEAGFAVLPGFLIRSDEEVISTDPYLISVGVEEGPWWVPPTPAWEPAEEELVVGQTTLVSLNLTRSADFAFPERIDVESPENAVFEEVTGLGSVTELELLGQRLLSYPVATYLITPTAVGTLEIPPAVTEVRGLSRSTDAVSLAVRPVPEAAAESGAVGRFQVEASVSDDRVALGEHVTLSIVVSGEGNLSYLEFPEIEAPGFLVTDRMETFDAEPTAQGYRGRRTLEVRLQATDTAEAQNVQVSPFVYYDTGSRSVRTLSLGSFRVEVFDAGDAVVSPEAFPYRLLSDEEREAVAPRDFYLKPWFYLLLLPPVLLSILLPALRTSGIVALLAITALAPRVDAQGGESEAEVARRLYQSGVLGSAYETLAPIAEESTDPGILYNFAILAYQMDIAGEGIYYLREAIRLQPSFSIARDALAYMERSLGLENQVPPSRRIHPDRYLVIFIILAYILGGLALLPLKYRSGFHTVVIVLVTIALLATLGGMGLSIRRLREPTVVVSASFGEVRRIPQDTAEPWVRFPEGTALIARDRHEEYFLVETGSEITGWIHSDQLLIDIGDQQ
ncbi:MAG: hypothetical protein ACLFPV_08730 [Spirochaetaceae bacterium]